MDYKKEIGRRIRLARDAKAWTLGDLAQKTNDVLTLRRIQNYEAGYRMPGPSEAVILSKALGVRPAYLMAMDDTQLPITAQEEAMIKNWRTLNERDRNDLFRKIQAAALQNRDPAADLAIERRVPQLEGPDRMPKAAVHKKVKPR